MSIKILLADDQKIVRDNVRRLLDKEEDIEVIGEADNGCTTVRQAKQLRPDLIIMDVLMPNMNGIEATKKILSEFPNLKILALSMYSDKRFVNGMFSAGAMGYVLKEYAFDELAIAIRKVMVNETHLSKELMSLIT